MQFFIFALISVCQFTVAQFFNPAANTIDENINPASDTTFTPIPGNLPPTLILVNKKYPEFVINGTWIKNNKYKFETRNPKFIFWSTRRYSLKRVQNSAGTYSLTLDEPCQITRQRKCKTIVNLSKQWFEAVDAGLDYRVRGTSLVARDQDPLAKSLVDVKTIGECRTSCRKNKQCTSASFDGVKCTWFQTPGGAQRMDNAVSFVKKREILIAHYADFNVLLLLSKFTTESAWSIIFHTELSGIIPRSIKLHDTSSGNNPSKCLMFTQSNDIPHAHMGKCVNPPSVTLINMAEINDGHDLMSIFEIDIAIGAGANSRTTFYHEKQGGRFVLG